MARRGQSRDLDAAEPLPFWVPPGWYPDPLAVGAARYWDGSGWSNRYRDAPPPESVPDRPPASGEESTRAPRPTTKRKRWPWAVAGIIVLLIIVGAALPGKNKPSPSSSSAQITSSAHSPAVPRSKPARAPADCVESLENKEGSACGAAGKKRCRSHEMHQLYETVYYAVAETYKGSNPDADGVAKRLHGQCLSVGVNLGRVPTGAERPAPATAEEESATKEEEQKNREAREKEAHEEVEQIREGKRLTEEGK